MKARRKRPGSFASHSAPPERDDERTPGLPIIVIPADIAAREAAQAAERAAEDTRHRLLAYTTDEVTKICRDLYVALGIAVQMGSAPVVDAMNPLIDQIRGEIRRRNNIAAVNVDGAKQEK